MNSKAANGEVGGINEGLEVRDRSKGEDIGDDADDHVGVRREDYNYYGVMGNDEMTKGVWVGKD